MRYSEFLKSMQTGAVSPVVTFLGEESFLKERAMEAIQKKFLEGDSRSFNYRSLQGEDLKDASFLDEASTLPMFGDWKVLYVKDSAALEKSMTKVKEYLESYLEHPSSGTILVFDIPQWEGHAKLKSLLTKKTTVVEFNSLSEKEIPSWIQSHLKTMNFQIDSNAIQMIVERLGTDLQKITSELEKLMLLRQSERKITLDDVEAGVGYSPSATVWQWSEALMDKNPTQAMRLLNDLIMLGEQPVYCISMLARQYEKMILAKEMVLQKIPQATIAQKINKPVYYLQKYLNQLSGFTMGDLVKAVQVLAYADRALKTSQISDQTILELTTIQLCNLKETAAPIFSIPLVL